MEQSGRSGNKAMGNMDSFLGKLEMFVGSVSLILPHFPARKMSESPNIVCAPWNTA
jgi:hypothetical protein